MSRTMRTERTMGKVDVIKFGNWTLTFPKLENTGNSNIERKLALKRSLKKFPMDHTREEAVKSGQGQRAFRQQFQKRMTQTRTESENLRQYSRKMFESVVKDNSSRNVTPFDAWRSNESIYSGSRSSSRPTTPLNNGPTHDGSYLYNQRSKILNTIRLRQNSDNQSTAYNHERAKSIPPAIQRTLCQSNSEFRVIQTPTPNHHDRSLSSASDYKLIPLNGAFSDYSSTLDLNLNSDHGDSVFNDDTVDTPRTCSQTSSDLTYRNRFVTPTQMRFYSLEGDDTSSESSVNTKKEEAIEKPVEEPKKEQLVVETKEQEKKPKSAGRPKSGSRPKSGARVKSGGRTKSGKKKATAKDPEPPPPPPPQPEPVPVAVTPTPKVRKPLKGPHCWVDDATVSSIHDAADDQRLSDTEQQADEGRTSRNSKTSQGVKHVTHNVSSAAKKHEELPVPVKTPVPNNEQILQQTEENISKQKQVVINISDVEDNFDKFDFPKFLCPSSEKKSREAAVQDWLAHTNFHNGLASVPLF